MNKKLTKSQIKRLEILAFHKEQLETCASSLAVEKTAERFNMTTQRIWQILRETKLNGPVNYLPNGKPI